MIKTKQGITLVALIITIIILLILAGVSISYLLNEGVLDKSQQAVNEYQKSSTNEQEVLNMIDDYLDNKLNGGVNPDDIYNESGLNDYIAPQDLFTYEIIEDDLSISKLSNSSMDGLPTKKARITGIKPEYCNGGGYNPSTNWMDLDDTNYEIKYEGIKDMLVIPYQLKIDNEFYKVTEVDLSILGVGDIDLGCPGSSGYSLPAIKKIVYPNTIEKINRKNISIYNYQYVDYENKMKLQEIVLSSSLKYIDSNMFSNINELNKIIIPKSVTFIGGYAFDGWNSTQTIYFECSEIDSINWDPHWKDGCDANIIWDYKITE